jgi:WD40 repeat protein
LNASIGGFPRAFVEAGEYRVVYLLALDQGRPCRSTGGPAAVRNGLQGADRPVISIAISPDGALIAAASIGGSVAVIDRKTRALERTLVGPGLPVWSVAFLPDSRTLLTGGADHIIRRWNVVTGDPIDPLLLEAAGDPLAAYAGDHGADIFRACVACHTLGADQANRAVRPWPASSADGSQRCRVIIFPKPSSVSILFGRRRRFPDCSRLDLRPTRRAPRCQSSASGRNRIAPLWCSSLSARQRDRRLINWLRYWRLLVSRLP